MWASESLQAVGVIVLLTVMTTVDASESEVSSDEPPRDVGSSLDGVGTGFDPTTTIGASSEDYTRGNLNSTKKLSNQEEDFLAFYSSLDYYTTENSSAAFKRNSNCTTPESEIPREDQLIEILETTERDLSVEENQLFTEERNRSKNFTQDVDKSLKILNTDNVRAISFKVPGKDSIGFNEKKDPKKTSNQFIKIGSFGDYDKAKILTSKDPKPKGTSDKDLDIEIKDKNQINKVKTAKSFYEIKSLVTTEVSVDFDQGSDLNPNQRNQRKFVIPTMASSMGKYGPYFEDGNEEKNITARIGSTVLLDCKIGMLRDKTVTWIQHKKDSIHLLTIARQVYSADQRVSLSFRYPSNWRLQILYATLGDSGVYECQVATYPPRIKKINLIVTTPVLTIVDDAGRVVAAGERHLKAGSILKLSCEARDVREKEGESVVWTRGDETLVENVSDNKTTELISGEEIHVVVSTVSVERATPRHAGNYSCSVPGRTKSTVVVHVLNGELPAAVHDGNGVSHAVLNLWLVHLTISYVFSR